MLYPDLNLHLYLCLYLRLYPSHRIRWVSDDWQVPAL